MSSSCSPKRVKRKVVSKRDTPAAPKVHAKKDLKTHAVQEAKRVIEQDAEKETSLLAELAASLTESTEPTKGDETKPPQLSDYEEEATKDTLLLEEPEPALDRLDELSLSEPSAVKRSRRAARFQEPQSTQSGKDEFRRGRGVGIRPRIDHGQLQPCQSLLDDGIYMPGGII